MEAMKTTVTPNFKNIISNIGDIGVIHRYFSSYCQYSSRYDNFKKGSVQNAFNPEFSNGAVMDIGIYNDISFSGLYLTFCGAGVS